MHYELWALNAGNLIRDVDTEVEAMALVRDLIASGWSTDDLGLGLEWDDGEEGDDALLPPALYGPSLSALLDGSHIGIERHTWIIGGSAYIRHTRIPVWMLEQARRLGASDAEILAAHPSLRANDLGNAWAYVWKHREEIDRDIDENERA